MVDSLTISAEREQVTVERGHGTAERERYRKLYLETLERCATFEQGIPMGTSFSGA